MNHQHLAYIATTLDDHLIQKACASYANQVYLGERYVYKVVEDAKRIERSN